MTDTPFQYAKKTNLDNHNYWAKQTPDTMTDLQAFMGGLYGGPMRSHWLSWFPMKDMLAGVTKDEIAFVDVAGGRGHEAQAVFKETGCKGRFVLQDLPEVIAAIKDLDPKIERMGHDFMQEQPVKGRIPMFHQSFAIVVYEFAAYAYLHTQGQRSIFSQTFYMTTPTPFANPSSAVWQML